MAAAATDHQHSTSVIERLHERDAAHVDAAFAHPYRFTGLGIERLQLSPTLVRSLRVFMREMTVVIGQIDLRIEKSELR